MLITRLAFARLVLARLAIGSLLLASPLLPTAVGAGDLDQHQARMLLQQGRILPLERLLSTLYERYPGASLLDVELDEDDGHYIYEIELLTRDGVVRELEIDAATGLILSDEEDD